jgi:hypothetical protein
VDVIPERLSKLAAQYYVTARFAAQSSYVPVCGNLMHHAVELLLKAGVVRAGGVPAGVNVDTHLRKQFGHSLEKLWAEFKRQRPARDLSRFDGVVADLDPWEEIRYPSTAGFAIHVEGRAAERVPVPALPGDTGFFRMNVELCDEFFRELWAAVGLNPEWFRSIVKFGKETSVSTYEDDNRFMIYA